MTTPILPYPDPKKPFILDTDASDMGIEAVLSQDFHREERAIARVLSKMEKCYCITSWELLAIAHFSKQYWKYMLG